MTSSRVAGNRAEKDGCFLFRVFIFGKCLLRSDAPGLSVSEVDAPGYEEATRG